MGPLTRLYPLVRTSSVVPSGLSAVLTAWPAVKSGRPGQIRIQRLEDRTRRRRRRDLHAGVEQLSFDQLIVGGADDC